MKKFSVTIDRTVHQSRTLVIDAENEDMARNVAMDIANENEGWEGKEHCVKSNIHIEEVPNDYIDRDGCPYDADDDEHCWPAGGGLHKDCEYNADALYAYYVVKNRDEIFVYLSNKCFNLANYRQREYEVWVKGNTKITFEAYDEGAGLWGYMHTELVK